MAGFNLPPGCSVSDIPGNRPEDVAAEALANEIYNRITQYLGAGLDEAATDDLVESICQIVTQEVDRAVKDCLAEADQAKEQEESERLAQEYWGGNET